MGGYQKMPLHCSVENCKGLMSVKEGMYFYWVLQDEGKLGQWLTAIGNARYTPDAPQSQLKNVQEFQQALSPR